MADSSYKAGFLKVAVNSGALKFGTFELKSKRTSPYFFNAGDFYRGDLFVPLIKAYASAIIDARQSGVLGEFDVIFGPAYKGVPLASTLVYELASSRPAEYANMCYSFDRKEVKDHGEGGMIVGAPLKGKRVLIIDDVITAGTAKREALGKIAKEGGEVVGIAIALDRMEKLSSPDGDDSKPMPSAVGEMRKEFNIPIFSIVTLDDIVAGIKGLATEADIERISQYRQEFKASD